MTAGVIAAGDKETVAAGAEILRRGGNAVDAAVAAAFASFIAEVGVVHLGGSGIAQIYDGRTGHSQVYDFFSVMPGLGEPMPDSLDFEEVTIDFGPATQSFFLGRGAVAVPGNITGLCQLAADHGRLSLSEILEPAIKLAAGGVRLAPFQADTCRLLAPLYTHTRDMKRIFAPDGSIIQAGDRLYIPDLAETLSALACEGEAYARTGPLAQALLADQRQNGGRLTATDLADYQVIHSEPIRLAYRDYEVLLPSLSSSGGVLTAFALKLLSEIDIPALRHGAPDHLRTLYEVQAAVSRARQRWEALIETVPGDEAVNRFLDDAFVARYHKELITNLTTRRPSTSLVEPKGPANTSHLSVVDGEGLAVSLTTTAGESAGYVVPGTGFIPNNMLGEEDLHPKGFHTRPPGQRIPTMMTPAIILRQGQPFLVLGSGGSIRIRSAILQVLTNLLDFNLPLEEAVNRPRVHLENTVLQCEAGYDPQAVNELEQMGYPVNRWPARSIYFGGAHSVARGEDGRFFAAGDNRRGGATAEV